MTCSMFRSVAPSPCQLYHLCIVIISQEAPVRWCAASCGFIGTDISHGESHPEHCCCLHHRKLFIWNNCSPDKYLQVEGKVRGGNQRLLAVLQTSGNWSFTNGTLPQPGFYKRFNSSLFSRFLLGEKWTGNEPITVTSNRRARAGDISHRDKNIFLIKWCALAVYIFLCRYFTIDMKIDKSICA